MFEGLMTVLPIVLAPVFRSIIGWLHNATKDGKITDFEVKKLLETVVRVGSLSIMAYIGLGDATAAAASAYFVDVFAEALKKKK